MREMLPIFYEVTHKVIFPLDDSGRLSVTNDIEPLAAQGTRGHRRGWPEGGQHGHLDGADGCRTHRTSRPRVLVRFAHRREHRHIRRCPQAVDVSVFPLQAPVPDLLFVSLPLLTRGCWLASAHRYTALPRTSSSGHTSRRRSPRGSGCILLIGYRTRDSSRCDGW